MKQKEGNNSHISASFFTGMTQALGSKNSKVVQGIRTALVPSAETIEWQKIILRVHKFLRN